MRRALLVVMLLACRAAEVPDPPSYYDRTIAPILQNSCSRQTTGCHVETPRGNAVGNLDTTSFERLNRRRDLLVAYGPYAVPGLLQKVIGPQPLTVQGIDGSVALTTDIKHAAFAGLDPTSDGFATLQRWIENGATKNNVGRATHAAPSTGACRPTLPPGARIDAAEPPAFAEFVEHVQPILLKSCSAGSCHGSAVTDLALTCGTDDEQRRWNAKIAAEYLSDPPEQSELLRRTLAVGSGGVYHSGGEVFASTSEAGYRALLAWATKRGPAKLSADDEGLRFFAGRVQPILAKKGCMFIGCHSSLSFHEYGLRGGAGGRFSLATTRRNYELSLKMLALEAPDPHASRLIAKNLFALDRELEPLGEGILHRGGPLLEDFPGSASPEQCKDLDTDGAALDTLPAYCVLTAWHKKERARLIAKGLLTEQPVTAIAYVSRPLDGDIAQDFDRYRPGAELHLVDAALTDRVTLGAVRSVSCAFDRATADIRRPAVSWDGKQLAFAARTSASAPLAIYTMNVDGAGCAKHAAISAHAASEHGILIHDFDPAWAPDGRLVFASTRAATRTPDGLRPNADLYVFEGSGIRRLTFLLGQELAPDFKRNGQLIFSVEKRAPGFYQLAGRRQNLDGTDYHPLFAQRRSVGFDQLTDVRQLPNGDLAFILSDRGVPARGGALAIANRSIGPDQSDRDPSDRFYLRSLRLVDPTATGKAPHYRGPAVLPAQALLVSYASAGDGRYELAEINLRGTRRTLVPYSDRALVDAVAVFARPTRTVFTPDPSEFRVEPGASDAVVRNLDLPMLASLFFDNRRVGRVIDDRIKHLGILESLPPPPSLTSLDAAPPDNVATDVYGKLWISRKSLGTAPAFEDGSIAYRMPGGMPFVVELRSDKSGPPLATVMEEFQLYPGERAKASFRRQLFDANCGGCHGAISGREVDVRIMPDAMTEASRVVAIEAPPFELKR